MSGMKVSVKVTVVRGPRANDVTFNVVPQADSDAVHLISENDKVNMTLVIKDKTPEFLMKAIELMRKDQ